MLTKATLRSGQSIPLYGIGTWLSKGTDCYEAVKIALRAGVRLVDTAQLYENEHQVGRAIKESDIPREEIYVVSKLSINSHGYENTKQALATSLAALELDYVDLFLIHTPRGKQVVETWKAMLELRDEGLTKAVGVSNFGVEQLQQLAATGLEPPEVNQIELHLYLPQRECVQYCKENNIFVMGYCPFARGKRFGNSTLSRIAQKYGKSEAQLMIRWSFQKGIGTIPKSTNERRILENCDIFNFNIDDETMKELDALEDGFEASTSVLNMFIPWDEVK
jgi:methylglyoxal/glyoxal reductase